MERRKTLPLRFINFAILQFTETRKKSALKPYYALPNNFEKSSLNLLILGPRCNEIQNYSRNPQKHNCIIYSFDCFGYNEQMFIFKIIQGFFV